MGIIYKRLTSIDNSFRAYYLEKSLHTNVNFRTFDVKFIKKITNRFKKLIQKNLNKTHS